MRPCYFHSLSLRKFLGEILWPGRYSLHLTLGKSCQSLAALDNRNPQSTGSFHSDGTLSLGTGATLHFCLLLVFKGATIPSPWNPKHSQLPAECCTQRNLSLWQGHLLTSALHLQQQILKGMDLQPFISDWCELQSLKPEVPLWTLYSPEYRRPENQCNFSFQWVHLGDESLGSFAHLPCFFPHLPLNLMWE